MAFLELLFQHFQVVLLQRVENWHCAEVIRAVRPRVDLINEFNLARHANYVLDCATEEVLLLAGLHIDTALHEVLEQILVA